MKSRRIWQVLLWIACLVVVVGAIKVASTLTTKPKLIATSTVTETTLAKVEITLSPTLITTSTRAPVPTLTSVSAFTYPTCKGAEGDYAGPLIPNQHGTATPVGSQVLLDIVKIPENDLSNRVGFSIATAADPEYWAGQLGAGWYIDWKIQSAPSFTRPAHWQMIRVHSNCISPSLVDIQQAASQLPGQVWVIGNEPDVIWQDNTPAIQYAHVYHDLYQLIKTSDPTASIAVGGIAAATPLRLKYLDQVLKEYTDRYGMPMPVDWWTVHGYVLREEHNSWGIEIPPGMTETQGKLYEVKDHGRIDLFEAQIVAFRDWMAVHGYQDKPLALTEFGILMPSSYGFPPELIANYLDSTFTWLYTTQDDKIGYPGDNHRLVQKWAWFSLSDPLYSSANLGDLSNGELTLIGKKVQEFVIQHAP